MDNCIGSIVIKTEVINDGEKEEERNDDSAKSKCPPLSPIKYIPEVMTIKCPKCPFLFPNEDSLSNHQKTHVCQFCDFEIRHISETNDHFLNTHVNYAADNFICLVCSEKFDTRPRLFHHVCDIHTRVFRHQCGHCDKNFRDTRSLKLHERFHTGEKPFTCSKCDKKFVDKRTLSAHQRTHGDKKFECPVCKKAFKRNAKMKMHLKVHDENSPYRCEICDKVLSSKYSLGLHMKIHNSFQCNICDEKFEKRISWQFHMLAHKGVSSFDCPICGKAFAAKCDLNKHIETHTDRDKALNCDICQKVFANKKTLGNHMKIHTEAPKFKCDVCEKSFFTRCQLKTHSFVHTQKSDIQCEVCHKYMSNRTRLEIHSRIHQDIKPFKCELCYRTFAQKSQLNEHMITHTSVRAVKCHLCELTFKHKRSLRKHFAKKHSQIKTILVSLEPANDSFESSNKGKQNSTEGTPPLPGSPENVYMNPDSAETDKDSALNDGNMNQRSKRQIKRKIFFDEMQQTGPKPPEVANSKTESKLLKQTAKKRLKSVTKSMTKRKTKGSTVIKQTKKLINALPKERKSDRNSKAKSAKISKDTGKAAVQNKKSPNKSKLANPKNKQPKINSFFTKKTQSLKKPIKKTKRKTSMKCDFCTEQFDDIKALNNHIRTHDGSSRYKCPKCDKPFRYQASFEKHIKTNSCNAPSETYLNTSSDIDYTCDFCEETFSNSEELKSHRDIHTESILRESAEIHRQHVDRNMFDVLAQIKQEPIMEVDQSTIDTGYMSYVTDNEITLNGLHSNRPDDSTEQTDTSNNPDNGLKPQPKPKHDIALSNDSQTGTMTSSIEAVNKGRKRGRPPKPKHTITAVDTNITHTETLDSRMQSVPRTDFIATPVEPPSFDAQVMTIDIAYIKQEPLTDILEYTVEGNMLVPVISQTVSLAESASQDNTDNVESSNKETQAQPVRALLNDEASENNSNKAMESPVTVRESENNVADSFDNNGKESMNVDSRSELINAKAKRSVRPKGSAQSKTPVKKVPRASSHKCKICYKEFPSPGKLKQHSKCHTSPKNHKMKINMKFISQKSTKSKSDLSPIDEKVKTKVVDANVDSQSKKNKSPPTKSFPCETCSKLFASKAGLGRHRKIHKSHSLPERGELSKNVNSPVENSKDKSKSSVENSISPSLMENSIDNLASSSRVMLSLDDSHPFHCIICGHRFPTEQSLKQHAKSHVKKTKFSKVMILTEEQDDTF